ncbi:hypothetical protein [Clostridium liquoris]|jgi:hypothetical protein|nr:hypothetical protein [Clostridium liquoris]
MIYKQKNRNLVILKNKLKYILKHYMMNSGIDVLCEELLWEDE